MYLMIIATILGFLSVHSSNIIKAIMRWYNRMSRKERELFDTKANLKKDQSELSHVRDFVKYSKLQRKINAIDETLLQLKAERDSSVMINVALTYSSRFLVTSVMLFLSVYYQKVPVFIVDPKYDLYPFTGLIAFPNEYVNAVSVHFWMICCSSVAKLITIK